MPSFAGQNLQMRQATANYPAQNQYRTQGNSYQTAQPLQNTYSQAPAAAYGSNYNNSVQQLSQSSSQFGVSPNFSSRTSYPAQTFSPQSGANTSLNNGFNNAQNSNANNISSFQNRSSNNSTDAYAPAYASFNRSGTVNQSSPSSNLNRPPQKGLGNSRWDNFKENMAGKQKQMTENFQQKKQARDDKKNERDRLKKIERENELLKDQQKLQQQALMHPIQLNNLNKKPGFKDKILTRFGKKNNNSMSLRSF
ncbi:MAG: hypothetical protein SFU25_00665 [Candidatus Caenarcaniphilales bacterium]|nr:hypothetical protein [Candidatus Caenarcaniphilales bacterium]